MISCLYEGHVWHRRRHPRPHEFRYGVTTCLLDLDEVDALAARLRLFACNRPGVVSFWDRDHLDGRDGSTKEKLVAWLRAEGLSFHQPRIRLLTHCRVLGYVFNPVSFYFCHEGADAVPRAIVAEVNNTFGGRHLYTLTPSNAGAAAATSAWNTTLRLHATKTMHVSPFVGMRACYDFRIRPIGEHLSVTILEREEDRPVLDARISGSRRPLSDGALSRMLVRHPLLTLKVIGAIHWEALRLAIKGVRPHRSPTPDAEHLAQRARLEGPLV